MNYGLKKTGKKPFKLGKEERLEKIIKILIYCMDCDRETALGYAGNFEQIADDWAKEEMKKAFNAAREGKLKKLFKLGKWISIFDSEPEFGQGVLIYLTSGAITIGYRKKKGKIYDWACFGDFDETLVVDKENDMVTHWMPLPEPPEK